MKTWYHEDWHFSIEVVRVGQENNTEACRLGLEPADTFQCTYGTPAGFCPTSFIKICPSMEVVRCGGDLRNLGGSGLAADPAGYRVRYRSVGYDREAVIVAAHEVRYPGAAYVERFMRGQSQLDWVDEQTVPEASQQSTSSTRWRHTDALADLAEGGRDQAVWAWKRRADGNRSETRASH